MKALLYCVKAEPALYKNPTWQLGEWYRRHDPEFLTGDKKNLINIKILNGTVCIECEVKEAMVYRPYPNEKHWSHAYSSYSDMDIKHHTCLNIDQLCAYGKGKHLYAYHLENVKPVELKLSDFYEDEACTKPLTKAPQSYRFAYRRHDCTDEEARMINKWSDQEGHECFQDVYGWYYVEKCLIFSVHAQYCAKILNGEKDLEVRKTRIAEGVEYK